MRVNFEQGQTVEVNFFYKQIKKRAYPEIFCRVTLFTSDNTEILFVTGYAKCHTGDQFDLHTGRRIALDSALSQLWYKNTQSEGRKYRKIIWDGLIAQGFKPVKESEVKKLRARVKTLEVALLRTSPTRWDEPHYYKPAGLPGAPCQCGLQRTDIIHQDHPL